MNIWKEFAPVIDGKVTEHYRFIQGGVGFFDVTAPDKPAGFCVSGYISPADARLMASAPELLQQLKVCAMTLRQYQVHHESKGDLEKAKANGLLADAAYAVIAKAQVKI